MPPGFTPEFASDIARRLIGGASVAAVVAFSAILAACSPQTSPSPPAGTAGPTAGAEPIRLVIDTDMAPDDVVAIASLLRDPAVEVMAITVTGTGEAHCPGGMFVARSIVTMLAEPVTVACGPSVPYGEAQPFPDAWRAGADAGSGLSLVSPSYGPETRSAQEVLVELAAAEAGAGRRLAVLTLGPVTNIAAAVALEPRLPERIRLVSMLGAVGVPGNVTADVAGGTGEAVAEWNAHVDPTAVRMVLEAGLDWTLIPLDATNTVPMSQDLYRELESDHDAGPADLVFELWSVNPFMWSSGYYLWDPVAAIAIGRPDVVATREATLRVIEGAALDGGRLVEDSSGARVIVATSADRTAVEGALLSSLRIGPPRSNAFRPVGTVEVDVGDRTCEAHIDTPNLPPGLLRFQVDSEAPESASIFAFALGTVTWAEVEAFVEATSGQAIPSAGVSPPPVIEVASTELGAGGSGTLYGDAPPGQLGVACFFGSFEGPEIRLAGPFTIGP